VCTYFTQSVVRCTFRLRAVNAPHLVALVRAGARFEAGKLVERPDGQPVDTAA